MINIDIAESLEDIEHGLMFRKKMPWNYGMLFMFPKQMDLSFWGKNTYIPLDIAFIDKDYKIINIQKIKPLSESQVSSDKKCMYALQVNQGYFQENKIKIGEKIKINYKNKTLEFIKNKTAQSQNDRYVIIPAGKTLFHGTLQEFKQQELNAGGYDGILWTAFQPFIAQSYIPQSGGKSYMSIDHIYMPAHDNETRKIQEMIGLFYDYSKVQWQPNMLRAKSYYMPKTKDGKELSTIGSQEDNWRTIPAKQYVRQKMAQLGYTGTGYNNQRYIIKTHRGKILRPNQSVVGRLFILTNKQPLKLYDISRNQGDLTQRQYHNHKAFDYARKNGYDGIKINDFAQHSQRGNIGHFGYGIFPSARNKLTWKTIPASHPTNDNWQSKEYNNYLAGNK